MDRLPGYAVVSPVRNEADHLEVTARSMVAQTHRPDRWVIVDDGSTDDTRAIADAFAAEHGWITVIDSGSRHVAARGAPIVRAFNRGLAEIDPRPEFVVKMDGDLFLPSHYFEWVARTFAREPRAGIVGGVAFVNDGSRWVPEKSARNHVRGAAKAYRTATLEEIGGLRESMGWDGIDEYGARSRGWGVHVLTELHFLHYKPVGAKNVWWRSRWEEGVGMYFMGYRPWFALGRALYRMLVAPPPVLGGLAMGAAFLWSMLRGAQQIDDEGAKRLLREEQRERLAGTLRKRSAAPPVAQLPGGGPAYWVANGTDPAAAGGADQADGFAPVLERERTS
jgi:biofilm PGA synthesis N-glycosyltransferase PgaC